MSSSRINVGHSRRAVHRRWQRINEQRVRKKVLAFLLAQLLAGNEPQAIKMQSLMDLSAKMVARHWTLEAIEQAATQVLCFH